MSVYVECLIRNDFYDLDNIEAVEAELNRASQMLNDYLHLEGEDIYYSDGLDCENYRVCSDNHHMSCPCLRKGYWHVSTAYRYHQLFTPPLFVRKGFYDVAKALGKSETWYCDEFHLDNCGEEKWNYDSQSFEEWFEYIITTYGPIKEYPIKDIMLNKENAFHSVPVYQDFFRGIYCKNN